LETTFVPGDWSIDLAHDLTHKLTRSKFYRLGTKFFGRITSGPPDNGEERR
jgi:hypothetical protein